MFHVRVKSVDFVIPTRREMIVICSLPYAGRKNFMIIVVALANLLLFDGWIGVCDRVEGRIGVCACSIIHPDSLNRCDVKYSIVERAACITCVVLKITFNIVVLLAVAFYFADFFFAFCK